ncbi:MAG TPA: DUF459 domain-containing protein [Sphingomonas sp.]|uniref:SGNH/GDSL hydrolase family protein n=1 Tax=Sphingomonas sp. TaxID=28214 RepID=UPI002BD7E5D7|nr:DUF459 domain-containing protein [Sphingomonas sp.]HMI19985.1 DUF459 domain-containing protein [Sphingomonas sp.]
MTWLRILLDRTAVLFLGVAAGVAIGYAFGTGNEKKEAVSLAPQAAPVIAPRAVAPPPPTGAATPDAGAPQGTVAEPTEPEKPAVDQPSSQMAETVKNGSQVHVGVFGDSFGDGVYSALYRLLPAKAGYQVDKYSQQSTGFTRYRRLDLEQHDDQQIDGQPLDVAVISFGANDAQGVCDGGHCGALMGKFWQQVIGARVEAYVAMLRRHGATVYWVGLPVMRDPAFDSDARAMDEFYRGLMAQLDVPYIDIRPMTIDAQGQYQAYYLDKDGMPKLFRAGDGVHMSMNGYIRITRGLAGRIRASVAAAKQDKDSEAP